MWRNARLGLLLVLSLGSAAYAHPPIEVTQREVTHLLALLQSSGCQFQRNGTWHEAAEAVSHLKKKYDYLLEKGMISSTESFIKNGASGSSMSGQSYQVRCPGKVPVNSADWLRAALLQYRGVSPSPSSSTLPARKSLILLETKVNV